MADTEPGPESQGPRDYDATFQQLMSRAFGEDELPMPDGFDGIVLDIEAPDSEKSPIELALDAVSKLTYRLEEIADKDEPKRSIACKRIESWANKIWAEWLGKEVTIGGPSLVAQPTFIMSEAEGDEPADTFRSSDEMQSKSYAGPRFDATDFIDQPGISCGFKVMNFAAEGDKPDYHLLHMLRLPEDPIIDHYGVQVLARTSWARTGVNELKIAALGEDARPDIGLLERHYPQLMEAINAAVSDEKVPLTDKLQELAGVDLSDIRRMSSAHRLELVRHLGRTLLSPGLPYIFENAVTVGWFNNGGPDDESRMLIRGNEQRRRVVTSQAGPFVVDMVRKLHADKSFTSVPLIGIKVTEVNPGLMPEEGVVVVDKDIVAMSIFEVADE